MARILWHADYPDRARLVLRGADRVRFLHGMVTADIDKLSAGRGTRAAMLSVKGRLLAEMTIYALPEELLLSMEASLHDKVRQVFDKHIVMDDVEVIDGPAAEAGLYCDGPDTTLGLELAAYEHVMVGDVRVSGDPSLGMTGYRLFGTKDAVAALSSNTSPLDPATREAWRIEAGTARYGADLDEDRLVVEANLDDAISFDKGCYLGQEVVVRATSRGRVNRKLVRLTFEGREVPAIGAHLTSAAQPDAGVITSAAYSERAGAPVALAYVHRVALDSDAPLLLEATQQRATIRR
jgi:folate-binding protein YgfZ